MIANAFTYFPAAYSTTSQLLCYAFHHYINHPDLQEEIRQEARELLTREGKLDYTVVNEMPCCIGSSRRRCE